MAWTAPFTAVTGNTILASQWNTSGRDNLNAIWVYTNQGDISYATSGTSLARLAIGANKGILTSNGSIPVWAAALSAAGVKNVSNRVDYDAADQDIGTTVHTDITGATVTLTLTATSTVYMWGFGTITTLTVGHRAVVGCVIGGTAQASGFVHTSSVSTYVPFGTEFGIAGVAAGAVICKLQGWGNAAGNHAQFSTGNIAAFAFAE
jgi:hypothetical protein